MSCSCLDTTVSTTGAKHLLSSRLATSHAAFDASPDLLNCPNGVVDLRTGELLTHAPGYRFMHLAGVAYEPRADYSAWVDWLAQTAGGEAEVHWLQRAVGYTLTGHTSEEVLFYLYGPPRSGKGIFCETLRRVLGDQLAKAIPFAVLTANADVDAQNFALAPLKPTRLVLAAESNHYERFNEAKLKTITGGDTISCAFKHRDAFNYRPQFKVWLSSNQPVYADPDDDAVWGRIRVIPFLHSYLGREDKTLKARMQANLAGVLAWAVAGAVAWYQSLPAGLPELQHLAALKDAQRSAVDHVAQWMDDCCQVAPAEFTSTHDLYASYAGWCRDNGVQPKQLKGFTASLKAKHLVGKQQRIPGSVNPMRGFAGLKL
jgi:putative DNA primase/helicase